MRGLGAAVLAVVLCGAQAQAQEQTEGETIVAHGISTFGDLKYPADFARYDYVNPDAPKGGEISQWAFGGFDTLNPYPIKGRGAALATSMLESLMRSTRSIAWSVPPSNTRRTAPGSSSTCGPRRGFPMARR